MKKLIFIIILALVALSPAYKVEAQSTANVNVNAIVPGCELDVTAKPEKRIPPVNNWDTVLQVNIYRSDNSLLFSTTVNTDNLGKAKLDLCSKGIYPVNGNYNFCIRGYSHLSKYYPNTPAFTNYATYIDFSANNKVLLAGETSIIYDDFVNSLDLSVLIKNLYTADYKSDLNQDSSVNALDISNLITNFYLPGDSCLK